MKLYKITDKDGKTRTGCTNETQWAENVTHKAKGKGTELCTADYIHAYTDPLLAVFFNPIGGDYNDETMLLWEAEGKADNQVTDKVGCKQLTTIKQVPKPNITTEQRVEIAIRCAVQVYKETSFIKWADEWLENKNRTAAAAGDAAGDAGAAWAAAGAAAWAAAGAAAWAAAGAAAWAGWAAAWAARDAEVAPLDILVIIKSVISKE